MLNKVVLKGNIGRSPHFRKTQDDKEVGRFFLATSMSWKAEDGEWHTHTDWHRITVFKTSTLRWMKDVLKRGDTVYVEGRLSYHCWTDKYGQNCVTPHVMVTNREGSIELIRPSSSHELKASEAGKEQEVSQPLEELLLHSPENDISLPDFQPSPTPLEISQ